MDLGSKVQRGGNVFQVPGLGHRASGTGFRVRVRVQDMKCKGANAAKPRAKVQRWEAKNGPEPEPGAEHLNPDLTAETRDPKMVGGSVGRADHPWPA